MKKTVLVFGTFDILHPGHVMMLKDAARHGNVVVSLTTDELCLRYKKTSPRHPFAIRRERLKRLKYVSAVLPSDVIAHSYGIVRQVRPAIIYLGYDQSGLSQYLRAWAKKEEYPIQIINARPYRQNLYHSSAFRGLMAEIK